MLKYFQNGGMTKKVMAHAGFPKGLNVEVSKIINRIQKMNLDLFKEQLIMIEYDKICIAEMHYKLGPTGAQIGIRICDFNFHQKGIGSLALEIYVNTYLIIAMLSVFF
jgi:hypothetical protein